MCWPFFQLLWNWKISFEKRVSNIVYCLRQHSSRHGIPAYVHSEKSPFNSVEFRKFAENYAFEHATSSFHYSQSNGKAENALRTIKKLTKKAKEGNSYILIALPEWRKYPYLKTSPLPCIDTDGTPHKIQNAHHNKLPSTTSAANVPQALQRSKDKQVAQYNENTNPQRKLEKGHTVRVKNHPREDQWGKGKITDVLPYRSFKIRFDDSSIKRRFSKHVRFSSLIISHDENDLHLPI